MKIKPHRKWTAILIAALAIIAVISASLTSLSGSPSSKETGSQKTPAPQECEILVKDQQSSIDNDKAKVAAKQLLRQDLAWKEVYFPLTEKLTELLKLIDRCPAQESGLHLMELYLNDTNRAIIQI